MTLESLRPPPVEPAHPPINMRATRMHFEKVGQAFTAVVVAYPVVETNDAVWNADILTVSARSPLYVLMPISTAAAATIPKKSHSSRLEKASLNLFIRIR